MSNFSKFVIVSILLFVTMLTYAASSLGWGVSTIRDHKTMKEIEKECPNFYTEREGDCLKRTFRSNYFQRSYDSSSGGTGSGGK